MFHFIYLDLINISPKIRVFNTRKTLKSVSVVFSDYDWQKSRSYLRLSKNGLPKNYPFIISQSVASNFYQKLYCLANFDSNSSNEPRFVFQSLQKRYTVLMCLQTLPCFFLFLHCDQREKACIYINFILLLTVNTRNNEKM